MENGKDSALDRAVSWEVSLWALKRTVVDIGIIPQAHHEDYMR
jgi:hypothetical protein